MGGRGASSSAGGASAYTQTKKFIQNNGIPNSFYYGRDEQMKKDVLRAIGEYGKLNAEEKKIYDTIEYQPSENRLWRSGTRGVNVTGYSDMEIEGARKHLAHSLYESRKKG